jgi:hypothetical protein
VIRLSPRQALAEVGVALAAPLVLPVLLGWDHAWSESASVSSVTAVVGFFLFSYTRRVVLGPEGLEVWGFGYKRVPWSSVSAVSEHHVFGSGYLRVMDGLQNRSLQLPAPRTWFGLGDTELARDRQLIEQWWATYRNIPPSPPPAAPGDPWSPPDT